jgi:hypothetical protein
MGPKSKDGGSQRYVDHARATEGVGNRQSPGPPSHFLGDDLVRAGHVGTGRLELDADNGSNGQPEEYLPRRKAACRVRHMIARLLGDVDALVPAASTLVPERCVVHVQ